MPTYDVNEGAFELAELGYADRTVHHLSVKHPVHGDVDLIVHRAPFPDGKSLREIAAGHLAREAEHFDGYAVLTKRDVERGGAPAIEVTSRFRDGGEVVYQKQTHLGLPGTWLYFALSAPFASRAACDAWSEQILGSLRLHTRLEHRA